MEPVEPQLNARDGALRAQLETAMGAYRTALTSSTSVASVSKHADEVDGLLLRAQEVTADAAGDAATTFLGAFTILVREGLEALLVVVALLAFLRKAARPEALRYVQEGDLRRPQAAPSQGPPAVPPAGQRWRDNIKSLMEKAAAFRLVR